MTGKEDIARRACSFRIEADPEKRIGALSYVEDMCAIPAVAAGLQERRVLGESENSRLARTIKAGLWPTGVRATGRYLFNATENCPVAAPRPSTAMPRRQSFRQHRKTSHGTLPGI